MKVEKIVAKTKGQPDLNGECNQADNWIDCQKIAGGEKEAVAIFNRQVKTDAMNKLRKPAAGPMALAKLIAKQPEKAQAQIRELLLKAGIKAEDIDAAMPKK